MKDDLLATVAAPPVIRCAACCDALLQRFENPNLGISRTEQIAMDGTQKVPVRWLPPLGEPARQHGAQGVGAGPCVLAATLFGVNEVGEALKIDDAGASDLASRLHAGATHPKT